MARSTGRSVASTRRGRVSSKSTLEAQVCAYMFCLSTTPTHSQVGDESPHAQHSNFASSRHSGAVGFHLNATFELKFAQSFLVQAKKKGSLDIIWGISLFIVVVVVVRVHVLFVVCPLVARCLFVVCHLFVHGV